MKDQLCYTDVLLMRNGNPVPPDCIDRRVAPFGLQSYENMLRKHAPYCMWRTPIRIGDEEHRSSRYPKKGILSAF